MNISTAIRLLQKEQEFLGMGLLELLQDIQKHGRMVYSERTMQAFGVFMAERARMFVEA
jgi:molybdenum-dependent DNA-binding transcriptional regulator ModE